MLTFICCAVLVGLVLGQTHRLDPLDLALAAFATGLGTLLMRAHQPWALMSLACCAAALAGVRAAVAEPPQADGGPGALQPPLEQVVSVRGRVAETPALSARSVRVVLADLAVAPPGQVPAAGDAPGAQAAPPAQIPVPADPPLGVPSMPARLAGTRIAVVDRPASPLATARPGDLVEAEGTLQAPVGRAPPTLAFPNQLHIEPHAPADPWLSLSEAARAAIGQALPQPQAALAADVLLGGSAGLDPELRVHLQRSGLAHLVAIDGFKQALLAGVLRTLVVPALGSRRAALVVLPAVLGYTLLSGGRPSAVRASAMLGLSEAARLSGRMADPLTALVLAVTLMALVDPSVLFDVGLQLSASATLGIVLLWPSFRHALRGLPWLVSEPAGLTLAVSLATLPVNLSVFQQVSLVSPLTHVLAVPLVPLVMAGAALLAVVGSVTPGTDLTNVLAVVALVPTSLLERVITLFGSLPGAAINTGALPPAAALALACAVLAYGIWQQPDLARLRRRTRAYQAPLGLAASGLCATWLLLLVQPDGQLHVQLLQQFPPGEAVLIRAPTGQTTLVLTGRPDAYALVTQLEATLPVWEHGLDSLVLLDPAAQPALASVSQRYPPGRVLELNRDAQLELGGGATLNVDAAHHAATLSFGGSSLSIPGPASGEP